MNTKLFLSLIVTFSLTLSAIGYSADTETHKTKTYMKDSVITSKIKKDLAEEKLSSLLHIKVDTDEAGEVTLKGNVESQELADKAILIAKAVEGVTSVKSELKIIPKKSND